MLTHGFLTDLVSQGWEVYDNARETITFELLVHYDMLIVCNSTEPWTNEEIAMVEMYLSVGGGLLVMADVGWSLTGLESLTAPFGVSFVPEEFIRDFTNNEGSYDLATISDLDSHPILNGVVEFGYYRGLCLNVGAPAVSIARGDDDAYSPSCRDHPTAIAVYEDQGRAVFYGDFTPWFWTYYPDQLDEYEIQLLYNIVEWLTERTIVSSERTSWGSVKALYR